MGISFLLVQIIGILVGGLGFITKAEWNEGSWNNDVFIDQTFWDANPTTGDIIKALYGSGINDKTAYTDYRTGNDCNPENTIVSYLSPGINTLPKTIPANTIYILNSGSYINNIQGDVFLYEYPAGVWYQIEQGILMDTCSAIVGIGDVTLYNSTGRNSMLQIQSSNVIIDNINIDGTATGTGGIHTTNGEGIISSGNNITIHGANIYNNILGIGLYRFASNTMISDSNIYNNYNGITINNLWYSYPYPYGSARSNNNVFSNIQIYNNQNVGLAFYKTLRNSVNNLQVYNNDVGFYTEGSGDIINNSQIYNNGLYGFSAKQASTTIHNIQFYNNRIGINIDTDSKIRYYGDIKAFSNDTNTSITSRYPGNPNPTFIIYQGTGSDYDYLGWTSGSFTTGNLSLSWDYLTNPINTDNEYLYPWNKNPQGQMFESRSGNQYFYTYSGNVGQIGLYIPYRTKNYSYGSGIFMQAQTVFYSGTELRTGGIFNPSEYIGSHVSKITGDLLGLSSNMTSLILSLSGISSATSNYSLFGDISPWRQGQEINTTTGVTLTQGNGIKKIITQIYTPNTYFATHFEKIGDVIVDEIPDQFSFTSITGTELNTLYTSNIVTLTGMSPGVFTGMSVTTGYMIKNNINIGQSGTGANGDQIILALTSSNNYSTLVSSTMSIAGVTGNFSITTQQTNTPSIQEVTSSALDGLYSSGAITLAVNFSQAVRVIGFPVVSLNTTPLRTGNYIDMGGIDSDFIPGTGGSITSLLEQDDGKIIVGGWFSTYNGQSANRIIRLHSGGAQDTGFMIGNGFNNFVNSLALDGSGNILVGGQFSTYNGSSTPRLTRLLPDGSKDPNFFVGGGFSSPDNVQDIAVQQDGKIIVAGDFYQYSGFTSANIIRLHPNGSRDTEFVVGNGFDKYVRSIELQQDGKIIVGGKFTMYNGSSSPYLIRLNSNGSKDTGFLAPFSLIYGEVWDIAVQQDGKIIVVGGVSKGIIRLNSNGSQDTGFVVGNGFNDSPQMLTLQDDGKILVGGGFGSYSGSIANRFVILNPDGTKNSNYEGSFLDGVNTILCQSDGRILLGGTTVGEDYSNLKRLSEYSSNIFFRYTLSENDSSPDLDYLSSGSLQLSTGSIRNKEGTDASLLLPEPGILGSLGYNKNLLIRADSTPDPFFFTNVTGVRTNSLISSNTISITGMAPYTTTTMSVNSGYIIKNGIEIGQSGTGSNGDLIALALTSANNYQTIASALLNIGGVTGQWTITTRSTPIDWNNDAFINQSFWDKNPGDADILDALYGAHISDDTAYTRLGVVSLLENSIVHLSPGIDTIPARLATGTLYILESGDYTVSYQTGIQLSRNSMILGKGEVTLYSTNQISTGYGILNAKALNYSWVENININGGIYHSNNYAGIHLDDTSYSYFRQLTISSNQRGFEIRGTSSNSSTHLWISDSIIKDNTYGISDGIEAYGFTGAGFSFSTLNNCKIHNNDYGMYVGPETFTINNSQIYQNNYGVFLRLGAFSLINYSQIYNNTYGVTYSNFSYNTQDYGHLIQNSLIYGNTLGISSNARPVDTENTYIFSNTIPTQGSGVINGLLYSGYADLSRQTITTGGNYFYGSHNILQHEPLTQRWITVGVSTEVIPINALGIFNSGRYIGDDGLVGGTFSINNNDLITNTQAVSLSSNVTGATQMRFADTMSGLTTSNRSAYSPTQTYALTDIGGTERSVYGQYSGTYGNFYVMDTITYNDIAPDQFTFIFRTGVNTNTLYTSNIITLTGMTPGIFTGISVTTGYLIKNGSQTGQSLTGGNGDGFSIAITSSTNYSTMRSATMSIGGITGDYSVTTMDPPNVVRDNNKFVNENFWNMGPNSASILQAFGGSGANDETAYSSMSHPGGVYSMINVEYLNPGINTIPQNLSSRILYVLNSGDYIITYTGGISFKQNSIAIVGKGKVTLYSTGQIAALITNTGTSYGSNYLLLDNIHLDGRNNGLGGIHTANTNGVYLYDGMNFIINNSKIYNNGNGIYFDGGFRSASIYNGINNSTIYDNGIGIYFYGGGFNVINNSRIYNNTYDGVYCERSNNNIINNSQIYNNTNGIFTDLGQDNTINNSNIYNNVHWAYSWDSTGHVNSWNSQIYDNGDDSWETTSIGGNDVYGSNLTTQNIPRRWYKVTVSTYNWEYYGLAGYEYDYDTSRYIGQYGPVGGTFSINNNNPISNDLTVTLHSNVTGATQMKFADTMSGLTTSNRSAYTSTQTYTLTGLGGTGKSVYGVYSGTYGTFYVMDTITYIDTTKPTAIVSPSTGARTKNPVRITLTGFSESITGLNATGRLFTGNGSFVFTFSDLAGNTGSTTATVNRIDTTKPTAIVSPSTGARTKNPVRVTLTGFSESLTGLNATGHLFTGNDSFVFTFSDLAGNTGNTTATVNRIDTTKPTVSLLTPINNVNITVDIDFSWTGSDLESSISGYIFSLYSGETLFTGQTIPSSFLSFVSGTIVDGVYTWKVIAIDKAGNTGSSTISTFSYGKKKLISDEEYGALLALYTATHGNQWTNTTSRGNSGMIDQWYGVTLSNGHVTHINLSGNNLSGRIDGVDFSSFVALEEISFANNFLYGGLPQSLTRLLRNRPSIRINISNNFGLIGIVESQVLTGSLGTLLISGNQYVGFSGTHWNGIFLPPQAVIGTKRAVFGESGLGLPSRQTIEAGSLESDLFPSTGTFGLSVMIDSGSSGQKYYLFRSDYNDGDTWNTNSPDIYCTLDTNKYCTFQTDHLSLFAFGLLDATITLPEYFSSSVLLASVFTQTPSAYEVSGDLSTLNTGFLISGMNLVPLRISSGDGLKTMSFRLFTGGYETTLYASGTLDRTSPTVSGKTASGNAISNSGYYITPSATLFFSDNNLSGALLSGLNTDFFSGNFQSGGVVTGNGDYRLTITDLAGNSTTLTFSLWDCSSVDVSTQECSALIDLYTATNGTGRTNRSKWLNNGDTTPNTVCDWQGIGCTAGHVSTINLYYNNLRGRLPESFGNLSGLTSLQTSSNTLYGLPNSISNLTKLSSLALNNNQLTGIVISQIHTLTGLTSLSLQNNPLGSVSPLIGDLVNLSSLSLDNNQLTQLPDSISNLTKLTSLTLSSNQLTGGVISQLHSLTWLTSLNLQNNPLGVIPTLIGDLVNLSSLSLDTTQLTSLPDTLSNLYKLNSLTLSNNQLTGIVISQIHTLTGLASLSLQNNPLGVIPTLIGDLSGLTSLSLNNSQITFLPDSIGNLYKLNSLTLSDNQLTGIIISQIHTLTGLTSLNLQNNPLGGISPLIGDLVNLSSLSLDTTQLTSLPDTLSNLYKLNSLTLSNNQLTGIVISQIHTLTGLASLSLQNNLLGSVSPLIGDLSGLTSLSLNNSQITFLPDSIGNLFRLTSLSLDNNQITFLPDPIGNLSGLTSLSLNNNQITFLPSSLGNLVKLTFLSLNSNKLTTLPDSIGNLSGLTSLSLANNQLAQLPSSLGNLVKLTFLSLNNNKLTTLPDSFGNLIQFTSLDIRDNQLVSLPNSFGNLIKLTSLSLNNNRITALPDSFCLLTGLTSLSLNNNQLVSLPNSLGNLIKLTSLSLYNNQLTVIPDSFGNLTGFTSLDLSNNRLSDLPSSLGNLSNLETLNLSFNTFTESPHFTSLATSLRTLDLSNNDITSLDPSLFSLENLTTLSLGNNPLSTVSERIGELQALETIFLSNTQLSSFPVAITTLGNLTTLDISNNQLTTLPNSFDNLSNLYYLYANNNHLTSLPDSIGNMPSLGDLYLNDNQITSLPDSIGNLNNLYSLYVNNNHLTSLPDSIGSMTSLGYLYLNDNQITSLPDSIGNLNNLYSLYANNNKLTNLPINIGNLVNLYDLTFSNNQISSLPSSFTGLTQISQFTLDNNKLTGSVFNILNQMPWIEALSLSGNEIHDFSGIISPPSFSSLFSINLSNNQVTSGDILSLTSIPSLKELSLAQSNLDESIFTTLQPLSGLVSLTLSHNTISSLPLAISNFDKLVVLDLSFNALTGLSEHIFELQKIRYLNLSNNMISYIPETIQQFSSLINLNLSYNTLSHIPNSLGYITGLQNLSLSHNILSSLSTGLTASRSLGVLDISSNQFTALPEGIGQMTGLYALDFSYNQLDTLPETLTQLTRIGTYTNSLDAGFNKLQDSSLNSSVLSFLDTKDPDWRTTQILPPPIILPANAKNGGGVLVKDSCLYNAKGKTNLPGANIEGKDYSSSYYDKNCGVSPMHGVADSTYSDELKQAYTYAYTMGITTTENIEMADMLGSVLRKHMAKMISQYATNVAKMKPNTSKKCVFTDMKDEDKEIQDFAIKACQMGIMGVNSDGTPATKFNPNKNVTRAQFGAMLSRVLYGTKYNSSDTKYRYKAHLNVLNTKNIMTDISKPTMAEKRGYVMLMFMRTGIK